MRLIYCPNTPVLTSYIPPISKMVKMVDENPWTSDALIPKMGISKILKMSNNNRVMNDMLDIRRPT